MPMSLRHQRVLTSLLLAAALLGGNAAWAANNPKKTAAKAPPAKRPPAKNQAKKNQPGKNQPAKAPIAPPPPTAAQNLAQQQAAEQARKQADAAQAAAIAAGGAGAAGVAAAAMSRPVAPITPQDPAKLVGVAQAPSQGALDKRLVGDWAVASSGLPLGTLTITPAGEYLWKKEDSESKGKLLQVIPRRDAKPGVTYWKLKDGTKEFYAFAHPEQKNALAIYAVESNAAAAEATLKDGEATAPKPAADPDKADKS